jgi:hypothetical protein
VAVVVAVAAHNDTATHKVNLFILDIPQVVLAVVELVLLLAVVVHHLITKCKVVVQAQEHQAHQPLVARAVMVYLTMVQAVLVEV